MFRTLIDISMILVVINIFFLILYSETLKRKIIRNISKKIGRDVLKQIVLENKRKSGITEKELEELESGLKKLDSSKLEKEIINRILPELDVKRNVRIIPQGLQGLSFLWGEPPVSIIEKLNLEGIIEDKIFLEELRLIDKNRVKKERLLGTIAIVIVFIFLISVIIEGYKLIKSVLVLF